MAVRITDDEFIEVFTSVGSAQMARVYGVTVRNILARRRRIEEKIGKRLVSGTMELQDVGISNKAMLQMGMENGCILVGGDCHYWSHVSTAHKAFVEFCKEYKPKAVVLNGDVVDGARISRFPSIGWEGKPSMEEELEYCKARLGEIERATPKGSRRFWPVGNHDLRFENLLANKVPEMEGIHGMHLKDHFPKWEPCWGVFVNSDTVIKHRWKNGIHAPRNNTLNAGRTMVTNHLHSMKVMPISDYNGTRWGVDTGTMAEPYGDQFLDYTESNPVDWRSGFCMLP